ncbi:hypothetical protein ACO03V_13840 [Microbacterium sp. HMH0099]|uniref:hypothetical protein n=1 Tax=Microbacterium sp. HMH0099 TaxID=3414026 RepID=UPI003BF6E29B
MIDVGRSAAGPTWKTSEDDFVLGACARRIVGFAALAPDGRWSAFDDESQPLGDLAILDEAKARIWGAHRTTHDRTCASPWGHGWAGLAETVRRWREGGAVPPRQDGPGPQD